MIRTEISRLFISRKDIRHICCTLLAAAPLCAMAQSGDTAYEFLSIPISAHSAALGGQNISVIDDDLTLTFNNPALLSNVSDKTLNLDITSYISSTKKLSAAFSRTINDRASWYAGGTVLNYGSMTETDSNGETLGEFSAKDISLQGGFAYMLSDYWSGGVSVKVLMSNYAEYSSTAIGADLGLNYCDEENGFSFSIAGRNLGGQVDPLYETNESLPFDLAAGFSKSLSNAPIRLSFTFDDLTHWDGMPLIRHMSIGADILPTRYSWIALGYNARRAHEMKVADGSSHWAGFNVGAGLSIKRLKVGVAWGKYHISSSSLIMNVSLTL